MIDLKRSGKNLKRLSELTVLKTLLISAEGLSWSILLKQSGLSESTLSSCLKALSRRGLIDRLVDASTYPPRVYYRLTDRGFDELNSIMDVEEEALEAEPTLEVSGPLKEYAYKYLKLRGVAMDIRRSGVSPERLFLTFGLLPVLTKESLKFKTSRGEEYLKFLTEVYVGSVDPEALDNLSVEKQFEVVKFFWKMCSSNAYKTAEKVLGFNFNYPKAYKKTLTLDREEIIVMAFPYAKSYEIRRKAVFTRLKVISHPVKERRQIIKSIWMNGDE